MPARHSASSLFAIAATAVVSAAAHAQATTAPATSGSGPALTIYNQNFAVVRETVPLNLTAGQNRVTFDGITSHLEPDSVILRDPTGKRDLRVLEQNYESDPLSQNALLKRFEGKVIQFAVTQPTGGEHFVSGKIVRSGGASSYNQYGYPSGGQEQPIIQTTEGLRFGLPGTPLFPSLAGDEILKPTLTWNLFADKAGAFNAELAYVTGSMSWESAYNVVSPAQGDTISLTGWITMTNNSGLDFPGVHVKLMAGTPNKVPPNQGGGFGGGAFAFAGRAADLSSAIPKVTEQAFDEYHLYTLPLPTTLRNGETKQVEFAHADGIASKRLYVYDGLQLDSRYSGYDEYSLRQQREYGTISNPHVWTMREFVNSKENYLGIPLPKGKLRFYRQGEGGALEFVGENVIDHTPQGETIRVFTGDAFDLVGERKQTDFKFTGSGNSSTIDESFEIHVRNRKKEPVTVQIVEHLYRWVNWTIVTPTVPFTKRDSRTIEFPVTIPPDGEQVVKYTAHYTW